MADLASLHGVDDRRGHAQHGVAGEAHVHRAAIQIIGEAGHGQRLVDDGGEIAVLDVLRARPAHEPGGEDVVQVACGRLLDAVGGHEDGPGEGGELLELVLPSRAIVTKEVLVRLQLGVAVAGQHLTVGVDVDAFALGLLQQGLQVLQVVAGDEDALALAVAEGNGRGDRMPVGSGVGGVEQLHGAQVGLAATHGHVDPGVEVQIVAQGARQPLVDEGGHGAIVLAKNIRMVGVGGHALDAVDDGLLEGLGVQVLVGHDGNAVGLALFHQPGQIAGGREGERLA